MNYIAAVALGVLLGAGCGESIPSPSSPVPARTSNRVRDVALVRLRNCDYAVGRAVESISVIHAGDCTNPIHQESK